MRATSSSMWESTTGRGTSRASSSTPAEPAKTAEKPDPFETFNMKHGQGLTDEDRVPLDQQSATPVQDSKPDRSWKKNDDGTYTAPNGTVWRKAAAGGEESPVTGRMHAGGSFMPIHGQSTVKIGKGDGTGEAPDLKPGKPEESDADKKKKKKEKDKDKK